MLLPFGTMGLDLPKFSFVIARKKGQFADTSILGGLVVNWKGGD